VVPNSFSTMQQMITDTQILILLALFLGSIATWVILGAYIYKTKGKTLWSMIREHAQHDMKQWRARRRDPT